MSNELLTLNKNIETLRHYVYPTLSGINIVRGCGSRPCMICSENSPIYQNSMDFGALQKIFSTYDGGAQLMLFGQGDPIRYQHGDRKIKDVVALAHDSDVSINLRSHGCLPNERETTANVEELVEYVIQNKLDRAQVRFDFSVDGYGWPGISQDEHVAAIASFYKIIAPLKPTVFAFANRNSHAGSIGSKEHLHQLLEDAKIPASAVVEQNIFYFKEGDRASKLVTKTPLVETFIPWQGTYIEADGTVFYNDPVFNIKSCGNIFSTIFTHSLPQPEGVH